MRMQHQQQQQHVSSNMQAAPKQNTCLADMPSLCLIAHILRGNIQQASKQAASMRGLQPVASRPSSRRSDGCKHLTPAVATPAASGFMTLHFHRIFAVSVTNIGVSCV
jgi:hypothetical protein